MSSKNQVKELLCSKTTTQKPGMATVMHLAEQRQTLLQQRLLEIDQLQALLDNASKENTFGKNK